MKKTKQHLNPFNLIIITIGTWFVSFFGYYNALLMARENLLQSTDLETGELSANVLTNSVIRLTDDSLLLVMAVFVLSILFAFVVNTVYRKMSQNMLVIYLLVIILNFLPYMFMAFNHVEGRL